MRRKAIPRIPVESSWSSGVLEVKATCRQSLLWGDLSALSMGAAGTGKSDADACKNSCRAGSTLTPGDGCKGLYLDAGEGVCSGQALLPRGLETACVFLNF